MDYIKVLQKAIEYIDERIDENIVVNDVANNIGYSPFHFLRIFKAVVGETPMEYVTKRKLQFAVRDMSIGMNMNDVAFNYGYESYVGFAKAFKKVFGMSPTAYIIHCPNAEPPIINLEKLKSIKTGGLIYQPKITRKEAFSIVGKAFNIPLRNVSATKDAPTYWHKNGLTDGEIETTLYRTFSPSQHGEYCLNIENPNDWSSFTYFFGILDEKLDASLPNSFERISIPTSIYAVFSTPPVLPSEFVDSVNGTWQYILHYWFPNSQYIIDEHSYDFEFYDEKCHSWENEFVTMDIYIPIQLKNESAND